MVPSSIATIEAYQRARDSAGPRDNSLVVELKMSLLSLPMLRVDDPVQTSPPAMKIWLVPGTMICTLQKMSVEVPFGSVRWPAAKPSAGSQTS